MKIFIPLPNENWYADKAALQFQFHSSHQVVFQYFEDVDVIWLLAGWCWNQIPKQILLSKSVITTIHHVVPEKFNKSEFLARDSITTAYHVPCTQTFNFIKQHTSKPIHKIGYWVDDTIWHSRGHREEYRKEFGIQPDEYVLSSFQRDGEGANPMIPKREKAPEKFLEYVNKVSQERKVKVLLNAWRRDFVIDGLKKIGVSFLYKELPDQETVRKMYLATDSYVASGIVEGGCQQLLECAIMKVPCVGNKGVGMVDDVLSENCRIDIGKEIWYPTQEDVEEAYQNIQKYKITNHIGLYERYFEDTSVKSKETTSF